ncbi:MAG TPA: MerR family transcriptional regulator [Flavisolibacter sp.]|nr:MerR family transcriptional regulator [Flavisolibacter sp.]
MQNFTIRDIENLTGIKAHTLRIWEQRYNLFTPKRKESLHRIYDNEDLKQLLHISFLYNSGWKVSRIATLTQPEITDLVRQASVGNDNYKVFITQLIEAAIDFDEYAFVKVFDEIIARTGFETCIVEVCYPFLIKVGHLWSTNNVIPAQEHFSSYIIQNRIILETDKVSTQNKKPEIVLFCPQGEFHELPLLFINYLLRKNNWSTIYLGKNVKLDELDPIIQLPGINNIYLHVLTNFTGFEIDDYLETVCRKYPDKRIIASGESVQKSQRSFTNLSLLNTDRQIYDFINRKAI